jgi:uncharacterized protein (DUF1697 family)
MAVYVCLLRAIGPVTHARMSMAALREACTGVGLADVATVGNTGNLLVSSDKAPAAVRQQVQAVVAGFGLSSEVFIRTPRQMAMVVRANPFPDGARDRPHQVGVCSFHQTPRWPDWVRDYDGPNRLAICGAHLVVDYPEGIASGFDIEKRIGARMTQRNWRVFAGLAAKALARSRAEPRGS